jgi:hypothetical protein
LRRAWGQVCHFDIRAGDCLIRDHDGTELPGRHEALEYALQEIRELLTTRAGSTFDVAHSKIDVCDSDKRLLFAVPFPEALNT